jgi:hypothetical protein
MDGCGKTSTIDVTTRGLQSPCLRSRMEISLVATPRLSGNLLIVSLLVIVMRCCSTFLANVTSPTNEQEKRYFAYIIVDLFMVTGSYVHVLSHLMVITSAPHAQV